MASIISIFQKNWAFTTSTSECPQINTGSFGPCYVVTFTSGKFAAMAHIDDCTDVDSMSAIFDKFKEHKVLFKDIKVVVLGGWKELAESLRWGEKIVKKIMEFGCEDVNTKHMWLKACTVSSFSQSEASKYYHFGAFVDSGTGKTYILKTHSSRIEEQQQKQNEEFIKKYSCALGKEFPLIQIK